MHESSGDGPRRVLIVEDQAHVPAGHFPVMFAELATALHEAGCEVTVLTAQGWVLAAEHSDAVFDLRQLGRAASLARRVAARFGRLRPGRYTQRISAVVADAVLVLAARRLRRQLGGADVVLTSYHLDPFVATVLAGRGNWLVARFGSPPSPRAASRFLGGWPSRDAAPGRLLLAAARRAECRRRRRAGRLRIIANNAAMSQRWAQYTPWLDPVAVPFIACRPQRPPAALREQLGLPRETRLALLFGAPHAAKDCEVVWRTFARLDSWRLVVAGGKAADSYRAWAERNSPATAPLLFDGYATDEMRDALHAAADLVVLSYRQGAEFDSGTLLDAVAFAKPVVCSDGCFAAELVERFGLGPTFEPGVDGSLSDAVQAAPASLPTSTVERAQEELSAERMAASFLDALR